MRTIQRRSRHDRSIVGPGQQRHAQFNDTLYQLEPDIKQAPGGLRDLSVCRHFALLHDRRPRSTRSAARRGWTRPKTTCSAIRSILHLEGGRDVNVLTHELQERVAEMIGQRRSARRIAGSKR